VTHLGYILHYIDPTELVGFMLIQKKKIYVFCIVKLLTVNLPY